MSELKDKYRALSPRELAAHIRHLEPGLPISSAADHVHRTGRPKPLDQE